MLISNLALQAELKEAGYYGGRLDDLWGDKSEAAARRALASLPADKTSYSPAWPAARVRVGIEQWCMTRGMIELGKIDGVAGVRTQIALERWQDLITFTKATPAIINVGPTSWPLQRDMEKFYGEVGKHQVRLESPYPLYLDWNLDQEVKGFQCHEKVHDSALRVMNRVLDHYGEEKIHEYGLDQFGGCLNVRKMRNGSSWSTHAWGIAIDWDADRNPLRTTFAKSQMGRPEYVVFLNLWEAEGWVSLGRARNFDAMHVQAARLA